MTPEEEAYALAQERIALANSDGSRALNLSASRRKLKFGGEVHFGDKRFRFLDRIPDEISSLASLQFLTLRGSRIADISLLEEVHSLKGLHLNDTPVANILALAELEHLQILALQDTDVGDITPISRLLRLKTLFLDRTKVSDIQPLTALHALRRLDLNGSQVGDISPVLEMRRLTEVQFSNIPACDDDPEVQRIAQIVRGRERTRKLKDWLLSRSDQKLPDQLRGGIRFRQADDYLEPLSDGQVGPRAAMMQASVIEAVEAMAAPLPGQNEFPEPGRMANELLVLLRGDMDAINEQAHRLWILSQRYGRALERDIRAQSDGSALGSTMAPELREALENVVDVLPVFARQFPICRELDDERQKWERNTVAEAEVAEVVRDAHLNEVISDETAEILSDYRPPEERGVQSDKIARAGLFSARNLVYAGLAVVATAAVTAGVSEATMGVTDGLGIRKTIAEKVFTWLRGKPEPIERLLKNAPADTQASVRRHLSRLRDDPDPLDP